MNIRFYNARILTMADGFRIIENGEIGISEGRILFVGPKGALEAYEKEHPSEVPAWDRESDLKGNLLMPGFKNAHTHSAMTFLRSIAEDLPLERWLEEAVFPREAKLTADDIYHCTKLAILEYLTSGITAVFDMYLDPIAAANAASECGFRFVQVSPMMSGPKHNDQILKHQEELYQKLNHLDGLNSAFFGFHAEYTNSDELLQGLSELAKKYKSPIFAHNSETQKEVRDCKKRHDGLTPTEYFDSLGLFEYGGGGYHCVWLSKHDIEIFQQRGLSVITNSGSNVKLASGIAPVADFLKEGINVALGTDGPASNNSLDMFREMFLTAGLAKILEKNASAVDGNKVLSMATLGGAKAMGLTDCDVLAPGKKADLIEIDLDQPNMQPLNDITRNLVYSGCKSNVKMTMIDGKILYEDGEFMIGEDPEKIYAKVKDVIERIG
ncbi:MAG: amidohydrolase [Lachnospiraceae bacterium]|nr:amidohydrolase [Lachnospiraceae bacterium]